MLSPVSANHISNCSPDWGIAKEEPPADLLYRAEQGEESAIFELGIFFRDQLDFDTCIEWLKKIASKGHRDACYELGLLFETDFDRSTSEAFQYFKKAANLDHIEAMFYVGECYLKGKGVSKDPNEGFKWVQKAAEQGSHAAMLELSQLYKLGIGCTEDKNLSRAWLHKAADNGVPVALGMLGRPVVL